MTKPYSHHWVQHAWANNRAVCLACGCTLHAVTMGRADTVCPQKEFDFGEANRIRAGTVEVGTTSPEAGVL